MLLGRLYVDIYCDFSIFDITFIGGLNKPIKMPRKVLAKKSLSSGVLGMKFMQKSKEIREEEEDKKESHAVLSRGIPNALKSAGVEIKVIDSYIELEGLTSGRVSYKGMNPRVEQMMRVEQEAEIQAFLKEQRIASNRPDISDEAMASILSKNIKKRFNTKKQKESNAEDSDCALLEQPVKKPKFLKPQDD